MDKSDAQIQKDIPLTPSSTLKKALPQSIDVSGSRKGFLNKIGKKTMLVCAVIIVALAAMVFSVLYYRRNFTPNMIVKKAVAKMISEKKVAYNATAKLTFQYADREEKIDLNGLEAYSLLKKSVAGSHEMVVQGEHEWVSGTPTGKYDLTWSVSDKKVFGLEGHYQGYQLYYKVNPYVYSDLVDKKLTKDYSVVDLKNLMSKMMSSDDLKSIEEFRAENLEFNVTQVFQDDFIKGDRAYHYKVKLSGKGGVEKLLSGIEIDGFDFWIDKRNLNIEKIKGNFTLINIGTEGNNLNIQLDLALGN